MGVNLLYYRPWRGRFRASEFTIWPIARVALGVLFRRLHHLLDFLVAQRVHQYRARAAVTGLNGESTRFHFERWTRCFNCGVFDESKSPKLLVVIILEHGENPVPALQGVKKSAAVSVAEFPSIHRGVTVTDHIENGAQRFRRVQVVIERNGKFLSRFLRAILQCRTLAGGKTLFSQAEAEISQPVD